MGRSVLFAATSSYTEAQNAQGKQTNDGGLRYFMSFPAHTDIDGAGSRVVFGSEDPNLTFGDGQSSTARICGCCRADDGGIAGEAVSASDRTRDQLKADGVFVIIMYERDRIKVYGSYPKDIVTDRAVWNRACADSV